MTLLRIYYWLKPFIPRSWQINLRRARCDSIRKKAKSIWPIDPQSGSAPPGWRGWPENKKFSLVLTHDVETSEGQAKAKRLALMESDLGFRSSYNFVPERYHVSAELRKWLIENGFEVGVHDLNHDGKLYNSKELFVKRSRLINQYIRSWGAKGFRSAAMHHNLDWIGMLDIDYDASTYDTDPFEPQQDPVRTIFPFIVSRANGRPYAELPYTLVQDFTLFILLKERSIALWKEKLDWIARQGGMALINVHPDYISFDGRKTSRKYYSVERYREFLLYSLNEYKGQYWNGLPKYVAELSLRSHADTHRPDDKY